MIARVRFFSFGTIKDRREGKKNRVHNDQRLVHTLYIRLDQYYRQLIPSFWSHKIA